MSERETALKECVFRVRTVAGGGKPVTQWVSDCGETWTPVTNVFDPSSRQTCPNCRRPSRVAGADPVPVCQWTRRGVYVVASCRAPRSWTDPENIVGWTHCPYCGKPLALVPAEGDR